MKKTLLFFLLTMASIPWILAQPAEFDYTLTQTFARIIAIVEING